MLGCGGAMGAGLAAINAKANSGNANNACFNLSLPENERHVRQRR
jgi:hypothetical protein